MLVSLGGETEPVELAVPARFFWRLGPITGYTVQINSMDDSSTCTTPEKYLETQQSPAGHHVIGSFHRSYFFGFELPGRSHDHRDVTIFEKLPF